MKSQKTRHFSSSMPRRKWLVTRRTSKMMSNDAQWNASRAQPWYVTGRGATSYRAETDEWKRAIPRSAHSQGFCFFFRHLRYRSTFCFEFELRRVVDMSVRSLPMKSRKKQKKKKKEEFARYVIDTCFAHAGLVQDATDTDCQPQNSSAHVRVFASFKRRSFTDWTINLLCLYVLIPVLVMGLIMLLRLACSLARSPSKHLHVTQSSSAPGLWQ